MIKSLLRSAYLRSRALALKLFYTEAGLAPEAREVRRILVLRFDRIGDMVQTTPLFAALKEDYPQAAVSVVASASNAPVLDGNPDVDEVFVLPRRGRRAYLRGVFGAREFDLLIDPFWNYDLEWPLVARRVRARHRVGLDIGGRGVFYDLRVPLPPRSLPAAEGVLDMCRRALGKPLKSRPPAVYLKSGERDDGARLLAAHGADLSRPLVLLHPGAYDRNNRWSVRGFAEAAGALAAGGGLHVVLIGSRGDEPLLRQAQAHRPELPSAVAGSLRLFLGALSHARLLICNNSGPLHLALALDVPTLSTAGPIDRLMWAPSNPRHAVLAREPLEQLRADEVVAAARRMLGDLS